MKITEIIKNSPLTLSFEVFPPKSSTKRIEIESAVNEITALSPDFISVTYGAGGGTSEETTSIASSILKGGVTAIAHLSCISSTREQVKAKISEFKASGIENILALRGDIQDDGSISEYKYAYQLVEDIRSSGIDFCIGGACYPECHPESANQTSDIEHLANKVKAGCDFLTTQMFFDNSAFYSFMWRLMSNSIDVPVIAGVMPVTNGKQIKRICALSGTTLPNRFRRIVDRFGDDPASMKQAGIAYATEQIIDLYANGVKSVHVYTMNKPDIAAAIQSNLSDILKKS